MRVAVLGAFGYSNTGDNLIGFATKRRLEALVNNITVDLFSLKFLSSQPTANLSMKYFSHCDLEFFDSLTKYDAIIIGGGGLLIPHKNFESLLLVDEKNYPPIGWNALGSQYTPTKNTKLKSWYNKIKRATDSAAYISVRSLTTSRLIESCGCDSTRINIVPDAVLGLEFQSRARSNRRNTSKKVVGISVGPELLKPPLNAFMGELAIAIKKLNERENDIDFIIFPFGKMYGDEAASRKLSELSNCHNYINYDNFLSVWNGIANLDLYLSMRYHGVVSAIAQGVPTIILDCYLSNQSMGSKLRDLSYQYYLDEYYYSPIIAICENPDTRSFIDLARQKSVADDIIKMIYKMLEPKSKEYWQIISDTTKKLVDNHFRCMCSSLNLL